MKKFIVTLIIIIPQFLFAQREITIKGYVGNSLSDKPLPYASVIVKAPGSDTIYYGAITDELGSFELKKISLKNDFTVQISFVGLKTLKKHYLIKNAKSRIFIVAKLKPAENRLSEVVVKGSNRIEDIDKTTIVMDSALIKNTVTTIDVLNKIPEIMINPITSTANIKGKENTFVMVNGVMTNKNINLRSINPKNIKKIEIINIPSGEFDNSIDGIINIVLIDNSTGINIYSENEYLPHRAFNSYNGFMLNHKKSSFGIDYSFENKHYDFSFDKHRSLQDADNEYLYNSECEKNKDINNEIEIHYDYHFSKNTVLSVYSSNYLYTTDKIFNTLSKNNVNNLTSYYLSSSYQSKVNFVNSSTTLFYKKKLNDNGLLFTVNNNFTINNGDYQINFTDSTMVPVDTVTKRFYEDNSGYLSDHFIAKINIPIKKVNLETGVAGYYKKFDNNHISDLQTEKINYNIFKTNLFFDFKGKIKKLKYQIGLKYETYQYHIHQHTYNDFSLQPSLYFFREINKNNSLRFSYNMRSSFPSVWQVSSLSVMKDSLNFSKGNNNLNPMYLHKASLAYKFRKKEDLFSLSINAKYYDNMIVTYYEVSNDNVLVSTPLNVDGKLKTYININGSKTLFEYFFIDYDLDFYRETFPRKNDDRVNYSINGSGMLFIAAPYGFILGGMYDYYGKTLTYQGTTTQSQQINIFAGLRLFDDMAKVTVSYNFLDSKQETLLEQPQFVQNATDITFVKGFFFKIDFYFYKKDKEVKLEKFDKNIDLDMK